MVQGELFREDSNYEAPAGISQSFLSRYKLTLQLDKVLLLSIAMIFAFTLSHTFGVERGKRLMEKKFEAMIPTQIQTFPQHDPMNDPNEIVESETVLMVDKPLPTPKQLLSPEGPTGPPNPVTPTLNELKKLGNFTVQLVTYDNKALAEKEIARLKSKGYEGFIIPSGRFFQVCANYFDNKSKARSSLEEIKQTGRYPDAYVRPVLR